MCITSEIYFKRKENKTSINEGLEGKNGKKIFVCVVLYYNDLVVVFQCLIGVCEKQILRLLINIYFFRISCRKINT